jgi:2-dehydro-3-deoxyphosphogluconate aldolase / (4S)-4-hydroxy-2-oxoglutarate aldolase
MFRDLRKFGVVPLVKVDGEDDAVSVAGALSAGGLPVMEISFRSFGHSKAICAVAKELPDFIIGVGNILNKDQLLRVLDAHARFAFSPGVSVETITEANKRNIVYAPGVCTPTDILSALSAGSADFQFVPAKQSGGVERLKALLEPVQHLGVEFFIKSGLTPERVKGYLEIPQVAAVSASWVATPELITAKDWAKITENAASSPEFMGKLRLGQIAKLVI